jgi:hypothetical protein
MTTERILPAIALPRPEGTADLLDVGAPGVRSSVRPTVGHQQKQVFNLPSRAGILIGASAAVYAVTLAAVAGFQAADDAALLARRQPFLDAIARSRAANDTLETAVSDADQSMVALGDAYARVWDRLNVYETRIDMLAALVAEAQGSMASLPSRIDLPRVSVRGATNSVGRASAPKPLTKTRASGG